MKHGEIITLKADTIGVVVPADAHGIEVFNNEGRVHWICQMDFAGYNLPTGNWKVVCTSLTMTEDEAKGLVESMFGMPRDYSSPDKTYRNDMTFLESFRTLIESLGYYLHTNPFGEKPRTPIRKSLPGYTKYTEWREAQAKVIPNLLILNK